MPRMKYFCATKYSTISGMTAVTALAIWYDQLTWYMPPRFAMPTSTGRIAIERVATSGQRKLLHCSANASTASVARAGRDDGTITRQKIVHSPAPSSRAASSTTPS